MMKNIIDTAKKEEYSSMRFNEEKRAELMDVLSIYEEITEEQKRKIIDHVGNILNYTPRIGVFGKTGSGKSSLCNALFGKDICRVSDVESCTRDIQEVELSAGRSIVLLDVPGVGETRDRDAEYSQLYRSLLPELDAILWLVKGDDRAYSVDIDFYNYVVKEHVEHEKPFIVVLNQIDKIEPFREWNIPERKPGTKQKQNIRRKIEAVSTGFGIHTADVIPISAEEKYGLVNLVDELIISLPDKKRITVLSEVKKENRSEKSVEESMSGFIRAIICAVKYANVGGSMGTRIGFTLAGPAGVVVGKIVGTVVGAVVGFVSGLFSW